MKKRSYIAVTIEENGRFYSYVIKTGNQNNLLAVLHIAGIVTANICDTFKAAKEIVTAWNENYKANGTYMFAGEF